MVYRPRDALGRRARRKFPRRPRTIRPNDHTAQVGLEVAWAGKVAVLRLDGDYTLVNPHQAKRIADWLKRFVKYADGGGDKARDERRKLVRPPDRRRNW